MSIEVITPEKESRETPARKSGNYEIVVISESNRPDIAKEAWRIHADGYRSMGFVDDRAITPEGYLDSAIDKARGENITYYVGHNIDNIEDKASVRKAALIGGDIKSLPAYTLCESQLYPEGDQLLRDSISEGYNLKEICALARTEHAHPIAIHQLFRQITQDAIKHNEAWFFSIVSTTHESIIKNFGKKNFLVIGEDVVIDDERVNPNIKLRPVYVPAHNFLINLYEELTESKSFIEKTRLTRSFLLLSEGIDPSLMSEELTQAREGLVSNSRSLE